MQISTSVLEITINVLLGLVALVLLFNWIGLAEAVLSKEGYSFAAPVVFGILGSVLLAVHPNSNMHAYFWAPLVLDPSIALVAIVVTFQRARERLGLAAKAEVKGIDRDADA